MRKVSVREEIAMGNLGQKNEQRAEDKSANESHATCSSIACTDGGTPVAARLRHAN
jgi:hypothetical protein